MAQSPGVIAVDDRRFEEHVCAFMNAPFLILYYLDFPSSAVIMIILNQRDKELQRLWED